MTRERVAVVGAGAAGLAAAFSLAKKYDVTLFEASDRLGGHAWPVRVDGVDIDTAFLIFNSHSYANFVRFLDLLGVSDAIENTDMSIGLRNERSGIRYSVNGGRGDWIGYARNAVRPEFRRLLGEIRRFREASDPRTLHDSAKGQTLEEFLRARDFSPFFAENFAYPLGASVWSLPVDGVRSLPASLYFNFFNNHKMLKNEHGARWQTLRGSSAVYLRAFEKKFAGKIRLSSPVKAITRSAQSVSIGFETFDRAVLATHAEDALKLLAAPTEQEARTLGAWKYRRSESILHTDDTLYPKSWNGWASWNVATKANGAFAVTYYLNRIQKGSLGKNLFLSWGEAAPRPETVIQRFSVKHPSFTPETEIARGELSRLQSDRFAFAGSYFGVGFHEDAVLSGFRAAACLGGPAC